MINFIGGGKKTTDSRPHQMQQPYRNLSFEGKVLNVSKLTEYTWLPRLQL
jgi:hypothetical protein